MTVDHAAIGVSWPAGLTPDLHRILGFMCFELGPAAHVYMAAGEFVGATGAALKRRAEDEQAFMLHKLLGFLFIHGDQWPRFADMDFRRAKGLAAARAEKAR